MTRRIREQEPRYVVCEECRGAVDTAHDRVAGFTTYENAAEAVTRLNDGRAVMNHFITVDHLSRHRQGAAA